MLKHLWKDHCLATWCVNFVLDGLSPGCQGFDVLSRSTDEVVMDTRVALLRVREVYRVLGKMLEGCGFDLGPLQPSNYRVNDLRQLYPDSFVLYGIQHWCDNKANLPITYLFFSLVEAT